MESIVWASVIVNVFLAGVLSFLVFRLRAGSFMIPPRFWTFRRGRWAIVELLGHVKFGALVTPERLPGGWALRCEIPGLGVDEGGVQFISSGSAIYRLTLCSEETATEVAEREIADWRRGWRSGLVPFVAGKVEVGEPELPMDEAGPDYCVRCDEPSELCDCDYEDRVEEARDRIEEARGMMESAGAKVDPDDEVPF